MINEKTSLYEMANALDSSGEYRVLRKFSYNHLETKPEHPRVRIGLFLDLETTGLDPTHDEIIEIGMVPFAYNINGTLLGVLPSFNRLREPSVPIPPEITRLTGITSDMLKGKNFTSEEVAAFALQADLIIAHNADFDRTFIENFCPDLANKPWACSMADIPWELAGFEGKKLGHLVMQAGFFFKGHRAQDDCLATIGLLGLNIFPEGKTGLSYLLKRARTEFVRIWAINSSFDSKDILKARGYRWNDGSNGQPKSWFIDCHPDKQAEETDFLCKEIYKRNTSLKINPIKAIDRFTNRS